VVVYHVIEIGKWTSFPISGPLLIARAGWMGVDLFFVISGFVIGLSALQGYARQGADFRRTFARRRLARIVPLYALTALLFLLLVEPSLLTLPLKTVAIHLGSHALFVHNMHPTTHGSIDGPNWSVALEMQFYASMWLLTPWIARSRPLVFVPALVAVAWTWRALVAWIVVPDVAHAHVLFTYSAQLPGTVDAFAFGIALAMALTSGRPSPLARLLQTSWQNFVLWGVGFALLFFLAMSTYWPRASYWDQFAMIAFWRTLLAASFTCLVAAAITLPAQNAIVLRPLRYLGEISYGIYLWHLLVLLTFTAIPWLTGQRLMWHVLLGTIVLASFSWHFYERQFIRRSHTT
jgi:peptidoglycan/LPS O-acetylase OafA/YrhL